MGDQFKSYETKLKGKIMQEGSETVGTIKDSETVLVKVEIKWISEDVPAGNLPREASKLIVQKSLTKKERIALAQKLVHDHWDITTIAEEFSKEIISTMRFPHENFQENFQGEKK